MMHQCLLCHGTSHELYCLSGEELRVLWAAGGVCLDEAAFGPINRDFEVPLLECDRCGFRFFDPALAGTETFYRQLRDENYYAAARPEFIRALNFAKRHQLKKVLDVGCGAGAFLDLARDHDLTAHGLELNTTAAEDARSRSHTIFTQLLHEVDQKEFRER